MRFKFTLIDVALAIFIICLAFDLVEVKLCISASGGCVAAGDDEQPKVQRRKDDKVNFTRDAFFSEKEST